MAGTDIRSAQEVEIINPGTGVGCEPASDGTLPVGSYDSGGTRIDPAKDRTTAASPSAVRISTGAGFVDPTQIRALTSSDTVTAIQGTAAAASGGWPVKVTDGTNFQAMMDVVTRAGFVKVTDGTNTMPTMDVAARAGFLKIVDTGGTNVAGVDAANAQYVGGKSAVGVTPTSNPVYVSGVDGGGLKRGILTDTTGSVATFDSSSQSATYMASTSGTVSSGTTGGTVTSLAYLFHGAGVAKRYEIVRVVASVLIGQGNSGNLTLRMARITAENGTPGGSTPAINPNDSSDAASGGTWRTGAAAPTRVSGDFVTEAVDCYTSSFGGGVSHQTSVVLFEYKPGAKPLTIRSGVAEGLEVRSVVGTAIGTACPIAVTFYWKEI